MIRYPIISADFARTDDLPSIGQVIFLGSVEQHPDYATWEQQTVTICDEGELEAEARLIRYPWYGEDMWYAVIAYPIRDISPETLAENGGHARVIQRR